MATAQLVIDRARQLINDVASSFVSGLRWSDDELLRWLTDAQREIIELQPEANPITDVFTVVGDAPRQELDPNIASQLIRVEANGSAEPADPPTFTFTAASDGASGVGLGRFGDSDQFGTLVSGDWVAGGSVWGIGNNIASQGGASGLMIYAFNALAQNYFTSVSIPDLGLDLNTADASFDNGSGDGPNSVWWWGAVAPGLTAGQTYDVFIT